MQPGAVNLHGIHRRFQPGAATTQTVRIASAPTLLVGRRSGIHVLTGSVRSAWPDASVAGNGISRPPAEASRRSAR
jgi:hypothetical protein